MKAKRLKILLSVLLLSFVTAVSISVLINYYIKNTKKTGAFEHKVQGDADIVASSVHYIEDKNGKKEWELEAVKAQYFKDNDMTIFEDVKLTLFAKDSRVFVVKGKTGKLMNTTKDVMINGDVVVSSEDGYKLKTESLEFLADKRHITTQDNILFTGPKMDVKGTGLFLDVNKETFSVLKNVRTVIKNAKI